MKRGRTQPYPHKQMGGSHSPPQESTAAKVAAKPPTHTPTVLCRVAGKWQQLTWYEAALAPKEWGV